MTKRFLSTALLCIHSSLREVIPHYKGFILDQYGVLHNGKEPLPGAIEAIQTLVAEGKQLVILSNTSSPSNSALEKLEKLGFDSKWFVGGAVTSGQEASKYIRDTYASSLSKTQRIKKKAIWITYKGSGFTPPPMDFLEACGDIELAKTVEEADFVILHGAEVWHKSSNNNGLGNLDLGGFFREGTFETLGPLLKACRARDLPVICANPDFTVRFHDGSTAFMPGTMAEYYEKDLGGNVIYFGKPHIQHFHACLDKLGTTMDPKDVIHVGDSLHHDIAGANAAGIDNLFVASGIHCDDLTIEYGVMPDSKDLDDLFEREGTIPTRVISSFSL